ncbi:MAG: putative Na+/H+ antiporter [Bdellovibrionota bacterium]
MTPRHVEYLSTVLFGLAIAHTFSAKWIRHFAHKYPEGSVGENFFHLISEIEVVFGLWAGILLVTITFTAGSSHAVEYLEGLNFTEPGFVFAIMTIAATRPVLALARMVMQTIARLIPFKRELALFAILLSIGPLLGSFITEPAAMAVTALLLKENFYDRKISDNLKYATLATLFVNISIGGTLTQFAAPPVVMVARTWNWDLNFMFTHFGWKSVLAVFFNAGAVAFVFRKELSKLAAAKDAPLRSTQTAPHWLIALHLIFLLVTVVAAHHLVIVLGLLLFFLGLTRVTEEHQDPIQLRESLLVAFFLGGLVVLGNLQRWWLEPLLTQLDLLPLFLGSTALTAITDNAALTYLGSQVPGLSDSLKYSLVAGAVAGGGLTVIANAPNPVGYGILKNRFGTDGIGAGRLFVFAIIPTLIAMLCLWFLPDL